MAEAKFRANSSSAPTLAPQSYTGAQSVESEAMRLYGERQYAKAAAKLHDAVSLYRAAEVEAAGARASEQERARSAERTVADRSRQGFEQARAKAAAAGADRKAADAFRDATELGDQGQTKLDRGDFGGARFAFEAAATAMLRAGEAAGSDQRDWDGLRNSRDVPALQAFAKKYPGSALAEQARRRIEQLDWEAVNKKDLAALRGFVQKHGDSPYAKQASSRNREARAGGYRRRRPAGRPRGARPVRRRL